MFIFRLFSSIVLISCLLTSILWESKGGFLIFALFAILLVYGGIKELCRILKETGRDNYSSPAAFTGVAIVAFSLWQMPYDIALCAIAILSIFSWTSLLFSKQKEIFLERILNTTATVALIAIPLNFLVMIYMFKEGTTYQGRYLVLFLILVTKSGDIGAYVTGTISNKITKGHNIPIVPNISPKKSWQGTIGGAILSMTVSFFLAKYLNLGFTSIVAICAGFVLFIGGFYGDLVESSFKRIVKIKDSGNIIPGMGGVLDVIDSLLLNAPIFYICLKLFKVI